jgi:hypothetical protein
MIYTVEMPSSSKVFLPSFMKIGTGIKTILRFFLSNLNGCNVGITNGMKL